MKIRKWNNFCHLSLGILGIFVLTSCTAKEDPCSIDITKQRDDALDGGETLVALRERGVLKVGFSEFIPWAMKNTNGEWIGFEIDVASKLTRDLELELELIPKAWRGIIDDLLNGEFDIIISGMSVTPKRAERVTFSDAYEYNKTVLLLNRRVQATSLRELNQPQYRFIGRPGSTSLDLTTYLFNKVQIQTFDNDDLLVQSLTNSQADGFLTPSVDAAVLIENYPETIYMPDWGRELVKEDAAFTLPKNVETAWLEFLNQWIETNWKNGFLNEKTAYWLDSRDWTKDHQLAE